MCESLAYVQEEFRKSLGKGMATDKMFLDQNKMLKKIKGKR